MLNKTNTNTDTYYIFWKSTFSTNFILIEIIKNLGLLRKAESQKAEKWPNLKWLKKFGPNYPG
jgi:hypothetical protein